ncbi:Hypothetical_protein [Hexamita inflata]|uniref:Hypothetical_protein n=1 Tax=Hexamita inflata TaxID=28002 RepID=A0AA86QED5_9EUKA|nr:Hypothetical protein HINF_LOCUS44173 [Hexamita inflata]
MMGSFDRVFSFLAAYHFLRCGSAKSVAEGKIPRFKVLSWHHQGSIWLTQVDPVQIGLHEAAALRPWMLVPESLVTLAAEVRLTYIGVSKTNDHRVNLQFLYRRPNQYKRKLTHSILGEVLILVKMMMQRLSSISDSFNYWQIAHFREVDLIYLHPILQCIKHIILFIPRMNTYIVKLPTSQITLYIKIIKQHIPYNQYKLQKEDEKFRNVIIKTLWW